MQRKALEVSQAKMFSQRQKKISQDPPKGFIERTMHNAQVVGITVSSEMQKQDKLTYLWKSIYHLVSLE